MKIIFEKKPDKIFDFGRFLDLIFGASEGNQSISPYGLVLQPHILKVGQYSVKIIQFAAHLYPRYRAIESTDRLLKKKTKLKITVSPPKGSMVLAFNKNFTVTEEKKLI